MKMEEVSQRVTPGRKIFTFSRDEVKAILLKAALAELKQSEPPLTKEEMYHRVNVSVEDGRRFHGEWKLVLIVEQPQMVAQHPYD